MGGLLGREGGKGYFSPSKIIGGGGQRVCPPPLQNYWGGGLPPPLPAPPPPSSYAYVSFVNVYQFVCLLLFLMVLRVGMGFDYIYSGSLPFFLF